jgi:hypothetical protein
MTSPWEMSAQALADWFFARLVMRHDVYGEYYESNGEFKQKTTHGVLTREIVISHIMGEITIGVFPISAGNLCKWIAADIDAHDDLADPEHNWRCALEAAKFLHGFGLHAITCDSNGRGGYHVRAFFKKPIPAEAARWLCEQLEAHLHGLGYPAIETFPKQFRVTLECPYGNWLRLPGKHHKRDHLTRIAGSAPGEWLEGEAAARRLIEIAGDDPKTVLAKFREANPAGAKKDKKRAWPERDEIPPEAAEVRDALAAIPNDDVHYDIWLRIGMCLHHWDPDLEGPALGFWDEWSERSEAKHVPGACEKKWSSFSRDGERPLTIKTLFATAIENGWTPPPPKSDTSDDGTDESPIIWGDQGVEREIEWLWANRAPQRKVWVVAGPGGLGKSFVLCDLTARVTVGAELPFADGECAAKGLVLYVTGEDDPWDTLVPRIRMQGGDPSRVAFLTEKELIRFNVSGPVFRKEADRLTASMKVRYPDDVVRLVVIDPPSSFLAGIDENSNSEVRSVLTPMNQWAAEHDCSVEINVHTNKKLGKGLEAQLAVMGSAAWVNMPRVSNIVLKDPNDPNIRLLIPLKSNIGEMTKALSFRVVPDLHEVKRGRLEWLAEVDIDAQTAANGPEEEQKPKEVNKEIVEKWLKANFKQQRIWSSKTLHETFEEEVGVVPVATFDRIKKKLDIQSRKVGTTWENWVSEDWIYFQ